MNKQVVRITIGLAVLLMAAFILIPALNSQKVDTETNEVSFLRGEQEENRAVTNAGRTEYFKRLLSDPVLKKIPANIRSKELAFAKNLKVEARLKATSLNDGFTWTEIGPFDVGGRTRALAIDSRNNNILIAGSASGGIWKSTDGGSTWNIKSDFGDNLAVTSIVQDPTSPDTWYYSTGEFDGTATTTTDGTGYIFGSGIFISTDNGESWSQVEETTDNDNQFSTQYDFISNLAIHPQTGSIYFTSAAFGVYRASNDFQSIDFLLGGVNEHIYADVAINKNGVVIAALSSGFDPNEPQSFENGIYISTNNGINWSNITPASYPSVSYRTIIGTSESNPNIFYVLIDTGAGSGGMKLFYFDITNPASPVTQDRTSGIPDFGQDVGGLEPQGGYNMVCKVSPNNSNLVFIGGTNLFRSTDGFSTVPASDEDGTDITLANSLWIGGYAHARNNSQYENHHADQHNLIFDPADPKKAYSTHDGGISVTNDITAVPVVWNNMDDGYNVTQFYAGSMYPAEGDGRVVGGAQDNGSPFFKFDLTSTSGSSADISSGDGAVGYLANNYALSASQNGFLLRFFYQNQNVSFNSFSYVSPKNAQTKQFIHPLAVNPGNEDIVIYPDGDHLWRQNQMSTLALNQNDSDGLTTGWSELTNVSVGNLGHQVTALGYSTNAPANRLYFAGSYSDATPVIKRLDDDSANDGEVDISIPNADFGAYVHHIFVNPENGNEVFVTMSNYGIQSLWYSNNAGENWTSVGGNLDGENGPSFRAAAITPTLTGETYYFVGTSIGLFVTDQLNGTSTSWTQVSENEIGNVVIADLDYRTSDELLLVTTHGRGMFVGEITTITSNETFPDAETPASFQLSQNYPNPFNPSTNIEFSLTAQSNVQLSVYDLNGRKVASVIDNSTYNAGAHTVAFDASSLASGTYLYRIEARPVSGGNGFQQTKTMTLIK